MSSESSRMPREYWQKLCASFDILPPYLADFHSLQAPGAGDCHETQMVPGE